MGNVSKLPGLRWMKLNDKWGKSPEHWFLLPCLVCLHSDSATVLSVLLTLIRSAQLDWNVLRLRKKNYPLNPLVHIQRNYSFKLQLKYVFIFVLWSPTYLIFNLTSPLLCFVDVVQDHLCRDLIFIKNSSNWKSQHFKGSAINAHNPHCPSSWRDTDTNCQVHVRRCSGFHIPATARGGRAAKRGTRVRPSGNGNCKNNSSDCDQLAVSLPHALGQPARQSSSQEEGQRGSHGGEIQHFKLRTGMETCPALLPWSSISTCLSVPHFPRSTAHQREHKPAMRQADGPTPLHFFILGVNQGSIIQRYLPSTDKKAHISCRLHSAHRCSCKVSSSPLLSTTE